MFLRAVLLAAILTAFTAIVHVNARAQDIGGLKAGVVRIHNNRSDDVGTGFIVKVDKTKVYILTAAHVVKGDQHPRVYLYNQQDDALQAELLDREDDDLKGLAMLRLKVSQSMVAGVTALKLSTTTQLKGGEDVKVIGFPDGTTFWSVVNGGVVRIEGRNLVLSGTITGGNSGGPVIRDGLVLGMITDVGSSVTYAARAEVVEPYVNGIIPNLMGVSKPTEPVTKADTQDGEFCQTLNEILNASKDGFNSIRGAATGSENTYRPTITLPGAYGGYVLPQKELYYYLFSSTDKDAVERQFNSVISKVRECLPRWSEKEEKTYYRYRKFKERKGNTVVGVYYNPDPRTNNGKHSLLFSIWISQ